MRAQESAELERCASTGTIRPDFEVASSEILSWHACFVGFLESASHAQDLSFAFGAELKSLVASQEPFPRS